MKKNTRFAFNAYLQQLARLNGVAVEELSSKFTVEPSVQQTLEDQIQQSAAFLTLINVTPVTEQSGQLLGLGVGSTIAGTTDTTAKEREPVDPTLMVDVEYKCEQTNFDTVLTYAKLDLWAKFQDFQVRIRDAIVKRQALDRIMIGFNGVKRAKTSNRSENPLLQDVNKGWLQKIRELHDTLLFADDVALTQADNSNMKVLISAPFMNGVVATHLPFMGEKGADFLLEQVQGYYQQ